MEPHALVESGPIDERVLEEHRPETPLLAEHDRLRPVQDLLGELSVADEDVSQALSVHVAHGVDDLPLDEAERAVRLAVGEAEVAGLLPGVDLPHHLEDGARVGGGRGRLGKVGGGREIEAEENGLVDLLLAGFGLVGRGRDLRDHDRLQAAQIHGGLRRRRGRLLGERLRVGFEDLRELGGRLVAVADLLDEDLPEDGLEGFVLGTLRELQLRLFVGDLVEDGDEALAVEGPPSRDELAEHRPHAEQVAALVDAAPAHLLRRHVVGGSHRDPAARFLGLRERDPEVHDLDVAVAGEEHVGGLDVAVDDARRMRAAQPLEDLEDDLDLPAEGEGRALSQRVLQVLAVQELHRDERRAVGVVAEVEDRDDVGVDHPGDGPGLALEADLPLGIFRDLREHDLERHVALEERVVGLVHDPHGSLAQPVDDFVLAEALGLALRGAPSRRRLARIAHPVPLNALSPKRLRTEHLLFERCPFCSLPSVGATRVPDERNRFEMNRLFFGQKRLAQLSARRTPPQ